MSAKTSKKKKKKFRHRSLQVSLSGRWYLGLTILLGVTALTAGNNILYLLESFLLGGLILSGVMSEWAVASITIRWQRQQSLADEPCFDRFYVTNNSKIPFFAIEVGVWKDNKFEPMGFIPFLSPKETATVVSDFQFQSRGEAEWDAIGCATAFPFGFARKLRQIRSPGSRIVWPGRAKRKARLSGDSLQRKKHGTRRMSIESSSLQRGLGSQISDGEVRQLQDGDDYRDVVWSKIGLREEPFVRTRRPSRSSPEALLDVRGEREPEVVELEIKRVAEVFYSDSDAMRPGGQGRLTIMSDRGTQRFVGTKESLDALAKVAA